MKFLVSAEAVDYGGPMSPKDGINFLENIVLPSFQIVEKWEKEGKINGGGLAGQRAGSFIMEASSAEELSKMLGSLPIWPVAKWDIRVLQSFSSIIGQTKEQLNGLKAMAARMS